MSHASKNRLSQYSTGSVPSRSRPHSQLFPIFHSSLAYTIVRDFAYQPANPMHYGPPPEPSRPASGMLTPDSRRQSDPMASWDFKVGWDHNNEGGFGKGGGLEPIHFGDGPPYSEDDDLHSPVVSSRHRKHKSTSATIGKSRSSREGQDPSLLSATNYDMDRSYYVGTSGDGSGRYYISQGGEANGPGGEVVTYPPSQARHSASAYRPVNQQPRHYTDNDAGYRSESDDSVTSSPGFNAYDESRYSRDYQFTITSPDEEMHGKAVALFDFARENENELPLVEGQIIWVSYRHGQGWLVAEDPKTQESGLVPEEYVRLLRDIEGGMTSLVGQIADGSGTPNEAGTPTQAEHNVNTIQLGHTPSGSTSNGYHQPIVSTFSTSSKDLDPYPQHLLGQHGQPPPQVVHYHGQRGGSQANTPTVQNTFDTTLGRRGSSDVKRSDSISAKSQTLETLPDARMESPEEEGDSDEERQAIPQR
ncbi:SH3 domain-containing protein [Xylariaceae sp. FL1019]|nr:SH3 domain-containing protein [Xylariaceae sp. FL1019]